MSTPQQGNPPLADRLMRLATTLQFAWWCGHFVLLLSVIRYGLSYITFNYYSTWAQITYRTAFSSAILTYGIVVYKAFKARVKPNTPIQQNAMMLLGDENVQYLLMSLVWLFSRQVALAVLPFTVYSVFHVLTYTRTNLLPALQPPQQAPGSNPISPGARSQSPLANSIGRFVKEYYDSSMMLVAALEIMLWFRLLMTAITFSKGSWLLLGIYTVFLRARFHQSQFIQQAFHHGSAQIDQQVSGQNVHPMVRQGWETTKNVGQQAVDMTDVRRYMGSPQPQKKAQ